MILTVNSGRFELEFVFLRHRLHSSSDILQPLANLSELSIYLVRQKGIMAMSNSQD